MIEKADRIDVRDEGVSQGRARAIDFVGAGVSATVFGGMATVTVSSGAVVHQSEVDFGAVPVSENVFTIIDPDVSLTSHIIASLAYEVPTGKDLDELEMDSLEIICGNGSGSFPMFIKATDGSYLADKFKINYIIG